MTISHSAAETLQYGQQFAAGLKAGDIIALSGELGAGKTCFVKGLAAGLDIRQDVTSPTYTLIHEYHGGRLPLYHIDLYRLDSAQQALNIGIEDYLPSDGITVIEWAEKIAGLLPPQTIRLRFTWLSDTDRQMERQ